MLHTLQFSNLKSYLVKIKRMLTKSRFAVLALCVLCVAASCQKAEIGATEPLPYPPPIEPPHSYLALGDSYTIGQGAPDSARWSVQLVQLLRQAQVPMQNVDIIARTGWTCSELQQQGIDVANNPKKYDLVSLLIGVNNQYRGQSIDAFRTEFRAILQSAVAFALNGDKRRVVVLSIPDWGATPFGSFYNTATIAQSIDAFNAVVEEECRTANVLYVDITRISRTARGDNSMVVADGLHYSGKMYKLWAQAALNAAQISVRLP
jgi:lysophospholipase L1-like esterase